MLEAVFICSYYSPPTKPYKFQSLDLILLLGPQRTGMILLLLGQNSDIQNYQNITPSRFCLLLLIYYLAVLSYISPISSEEKVVAM